MIDKINKYAKQAYETAKEHGFHDVALPPQHYLMLIITEVAEAIEADRKNKHAIPNEEYLKMMDTFYCQPMNNAAFICCFKEKYEKLIKGTVEDELADICIRIFDAAEASDIKLGDYTDIPALIAEARTYVSKLNFIEFGFLLSSTICEFSNEADYDDVLMSTLVFVMAWCELNNIDLKGSIFRKMHYNMYRPYKHNKEY